jgi:hypothetical protein
MAADGVGDSELDGALQRHGFEEAEHVAPKLCLGLQELCTGGRRRRCEGRCGLVLGHAICSDELACSGGSVSCFALS